MIDREDKYCTLQPLNLSNFFIVSLPFKYVWKREYLCSIIILNYNSVSQGIVERKCNASSMIRGICILSLSHWALICGPNNNIIRIFSTFTHVEKIKCMAIMSAKPSTLILNSWRLGQALGRGQHDHTVKIYQIWVNLFSRVYIWEKLNTR